MKVIFYHPLEIKKSGASGSEVRVRKILNAFISKYGEDNVFIISGNSNKKNMLFGHLRELVDKGVHFSYAYSENSNVPSVLADPDHIPRRPLFEFHFFNYLKDRNIPVGMFYRDVYWRHPSYNLMYPGAKGKLLKILHAIELYLYEKKLTCLFLPDVSMNTVLRFSAKIKKVSLPPGVEKVVTPCRKPGAPVESLLYIGGVNKPLYDLTPLLLFMKKKPGLKLTLCCRKSDYERSKYIHELIPNNVRVVHKSGSELNDLYESHDAFIIYRRKDVYHDITLPVKIYECAGHGIPIFIYGDSLDATHVNSKNLGFSFSSEEELDMLIKHGFTRLFYDALGNSATENSWLERVEVIERALCLNE
ncbi:hypothetical protein [Halomonas alkalicola]|uniref:hypothetical protein n=1 Tax=Halomonas alkalicola TaxID=1930622 RepID=UPI00265E3A9B|nr:hypothetical protein [Halomonas alkalicola]